LTSLAGDGKRFAKYYGQLEVEKAQQGVCEQVTKFVTTTLAQMNGKI